MVHTNTHGLIAMCFLLTMFLLVEFLNNWFVRNQYLGLCPFRKGDTVFCHLNEGGESGVVADIQKHCTAWLITVLHGEFKCKYMHHELSLVK